MGGGGAGGRAARARTDLASGAASPDPAALGRRDRPDGPLSPRRGPVRLGGSGAAGLRAWGAGSWAGGVPGGRPGRPGSGCGRRGRGWGSSRGAGPAPGFASGAAAAGRGRLWPGLRGEDGRERAAGSSPCPPGERLGELLSPWTGSHRRRGGRSAAGRGGTVSAVSRCAKPGCRQVSPLYSVEPRERKAGCSAS